MTVPLGAPPQDFDLSVCEIQSGGVLVRISPDAAEDLLPGIVQRLLAHCTGRQHWTVEARDDLVYDVGVHAGWEVWELVKQRP